MESKSFSFINRQSLFSAVRSGDVEVLKEVIQNEGSDLSALMSLQNDAGETPLYIAAENNLTDIFSLLLKFCDQESVMMKAKKTDITAFHVAASKGHLGIVQEFLAKWPEVCKVCNSSNTSPLYAAAVQDHSDIVNAILDADPTVIRIVRKNEKTALHITARYGILDMVKLLIERDPSIVSLKDKKGQTALHMAVKGQNSAVVEELLEADYSILNERDKKGNTAVHIATRKCRPQIVSLLLTYRSIDVNAINNQHQTAMDLADKLQYGDAAMLIQEVLREAGAKHARYVGQSDEAMELKRTVSDIKHEVHDQLLQNEKTQRRVSGIAKELKKIHREAVQNTINSVTVVAVLFASIAFLAIFNLPGLYEESGPEAGEANISKTNHVAFRVFCLLNATSLFMSLAVVVVQITLVAWDTRAQRKVVSIVNKLMWAACISTCGAFLSIAFVVVGKHNSWMAITITAVGAPILIVTLVSLCYFVFRQHFNVLGSDSQRRIRRSSGSKSFSMSFSGNYTDIDDDESDEKTIYAL
ncbi:phosphatase modulator [Lithospermum erythrorhizon]|uniref:Phosphatase modulator n=1 Tax=Lithospermum erythrorhizon TaxID=34254 RepID=A0AAV3PV97_LITER